MPPLTRRRALHGVAGVLAGLAGCPDRSERDGSTPTEPAERPTGENVATDPEHVVLRASGATADGTSGDASDGASGDPVAWFADDSLETPGTTVAPDEGRQQGLIASESRAGTLALADVDGADDARQFVAGTDFETETLYLEEQAVRACFRLDLCYVRWERTEIDTDYATVLRDHDTRCRADVRETAAVLIRIPDILNPGEVTGYGSGIHSGSCPPPPGERREPRKPEADEEDGPPPIGGATTTTTPGTGADAGTETGTVNGGDGG